MCINFPSWSISKGVLPLGYKPGDRGQIVVPSWCYGFIQAVWFISHWYCPRIVLSTLRAKTDHRGLMIFV